MNDFQKLASFYRGFAGRLNEMVKEARGAQVMRLMRGGQLSPTMMPPKWRTAIGMPAPFAQAERGAIADLIRGQRAQRPNLVYRPHALPGASMTQAGGGGTPARQANPNWIEDVRPAAKAQNLDFIMPSRPMSGGVTPGFEMAPRPQMGVPQAPQVQAGGAGMGGGNGGPKLLAGAGGSPWWKNPAGALGQSRVGQMWGKMSPNQQLAAGAGGAYMIDQNASRRGQNDMAEHYNNMGYFPKLMMALAGRDAPEMSAANPAWMLPGI